MKFTSVFYVETEAEAKRKLAELRRIDRYKELNAYYHEISPGTFRVVRKIEIFALNMHAKEPA